LAKLAFDGHGAIHLLDCMLNNRKAQTSSSHLPGTGLVHPVKALENPRQIFGGYAQPGVGDPNLD